MQSFKISVNSTVAIFLLNANTSQIMKIIDITAVKKMNEPTQSFMLCMHLNSQSNVRAFLRGPEWEESYITSNYYDCKEDFCPSMIVTVQPVENNGSQ